MAAGDAGRPLQAFRIAGLPPDFYYIPNFISVEEEASILQKVRLPKLLCSHANLLQIPAQRWINLSHRRLQAHPSTLTKNNTLLASPLPTYLINPIIPRFKDLGIFDHTPHQQPNHVLINEYKPGEGIMPHEDGRAYASVVATVSLGGTVCLNLMPKPISEDGDREEEGNGERKWKVPTRVLQEPRSLLITTGEAYDSLLHGVDAVEIDEDLNDDTVANWSLLENRHLIEEASGQNVRETRISLTYRDVLKVSSAASKVLGGFARR
jgi:alkylated DNA repair protein alkB family protein 6